MSDREKLMGQMAEHTIKKLQDELEEAREKEKKWDEICPTQCAVVIQMQESIDRLKGELEEARLVARRYYDELTASVGNEPTDEGFQNDFKVQCRIQSLNPTLADAEEPKEGGEGPEFRRIYCTCETCDWADIVNDAVVDCLHPDVPFEHLEKCSGKWKPRKPEGHDPTGQEEKEDCPTCGNVGWLMGEEGSVPNRRMTGKIPCPNPNCPTKKQGE